MVLKDSAEKKQATAVVIIIGAIIVIFVFAILVENGKEVPMPNFSQSPLAPHLSFNGRQYLERGENPFFPYDDACKVYVYAETVDKLVPNYVSTDPRISGQTNTELWIGGEIFADPDNYSTIYLKYQAQLSDGTVYFRYAVFR